MSKSEEPLLDFEKICRLCLLEKRSMSSIFAKKKSDKKVPLAVRIMSCAALELYEGDGLPASICSKCLLSVNQSYAFKEQCEQADTTLRQYAQRMNDARGVTSSNREAGEHIANDSLALIEDNGIKSEGVHCDEDQHFERISSLDLNCGKVEISSVENTGKMSVTLEESEQFNLIKTETSANPGMEKNLELEKKSGREQEKDISEVITEDRTCNSDELKISEVEKDSVNGNPMKKAKLKNEAAQESVNLEFFDSSILKALSKEKPERLVVVADMPDVLEDEDYDFGETGSEDHDPVTKTSGTQKWSRHGLSAKDLLSSQVFASVKEKPPKRSSFENKKNLELLQNLMRNKNIIVQKRTACVTAELLTGKISPLKSQEFNRDLPRKKGFLPYEFKIAQLWKEWEEVNKRIHKVSAKLSRRKSENRIETENNKSEDVPAPGKDGGLPCKDSHELKSTEQITDEHSKANWTNVKDTVYCKECRVFLLKSSFSNHIKFVHKKIRKYLCQTCGYAACTGTILRQHVQAVHVGYSFFCDQCPKKFNLKKRLRKHIELQHSGKPVERNHVCQYCGMTFVKPGCLKRHLRSHTQETPYQCQYCQRRFKYRWPKVQHERLHTGEKPYKCSFCEERFTQNCVRKAHEFKKHGNAEFKPKTRSKEENGATAQKEDSEVSNSVLDSG